MKFPFPTTPDAAGKGRLFGFVSVVPGAGAATLACAAALHLGRRGEVVLVDLCVPGKVRTYMGLVPDRYPGSVLDAEGLKSPAEVRAVAVDSGRGVSVIPAPWRGLEYSRVTATLVMKVAVACKRSFPVTVAVFGPPWDTGWPGVLVSDVLFVVAKPDREDLDAMSDFLSVVGRLGAKERTCLVANQLGLPGGIVVSEFVEAVDPCVRVSYSRGVREQCNRRYINPQTAVFGELFKYLEEQEGGEMG